MRQRAVALAVVPLAAALFALSQTPRTGPQVEPKSGFAHGRTDVWEAAIDAGADRPLHGSGALTFLDASFGYQAPPPTRFAHNLVLEEWTELGLAGGGVALILIAAAGRLAIPRSRDARAAWLLAPGVLAFCVSSLVDWPWHVPASAAIFALGAGGLAGAFARAGPQENEGTTLNPG